MNARKITKDIKINSTRFKKTEIYEGSSSEDGCYTEQSETDNSGKKVKSSYSFITQVVQCITIKRTPVSQRKGREIGRVRERRGEKSRQYPAEYEYEHESFDEEEEFESLEEIKERLKVNFEFTDQIESIFMKVYNYYIGRPGSSSFAETDVNRCRSYVHLLINQDHSKNKEGERVAMDFFQNFVPEYKRAYQNFQG